MAWNWGISIITFAFGLGFGFLIAYLTLKHSGRVKELEEELDKARSEHNQYRGKVSQHFEKTAELFEDMTERYRAVYKHMASSAQDLCEERPPALQLEIVDRGRLTKGSGVSAVKPAPMAVAAEDDAEPEMELDQKISTAPNTVRRANNDSDDYMGDAPHVPELTDEVSDSVEPSSKAAFRGNK
ncbi:MAG: YhcB family protein [Gammaproteobacteria bacterium]|nr:YhcB family protein [Gammaproteobacteria bacterium]